MGDSQMMRVRQQEPGEVCDNIPLVIPVPDSVWQQAIKQAEAMTKSGAVIQVAVEVRASAFVVNRKIKLSSSMREIGRTSEGGVVMMGNRDCDPAIDPNVEDVKAPSARVCSTKDVQG